MDIYDALTNARPYKDAFTRVRALQVLEEETDKGWRDPELTGLFIHMNQGVLSRIASYSSTASDASMQDSLHNLQAFLAQ